MVTGTKELLLKQAESLVRTRGFGAFSYADLSERVGIRKASIHHHFPTKEELGGALIDGYLGRFEEALEEILQKERLATNRLCRYADLFVKSTTDGMLPLCAVLSAEMPSLPSSIQKRVRYFFKLQLRWIEKVVRSGISTKELRGDLDPKSVAILVLSALEGASLITWALNDTSVFKPTIKQVVASLKP